MNTVHKLCLILREAELIFMCKVIRKKEEGNLKVKGFVC